ncbi:Integral membrane sensor signal transduction histidine kinase [Erythrobacter dokdonensis DSW-74]|uniref:histidine kinase n=2 Tax=Erythrobacter TaxID=1041 RepID=A0A1A7BFQ5_9SPHN|nr:Integral membrane sensor signal transduction histidine kinase [Erythrobacter dokdonensis DSW-74]
MQHMINQKPLGLLPRILRKAVAALTLLAASLAVQVSAQESAQESTLGDTVELPQGNNHLQPFASLRYLIVDAERLAPEAVIARRDQFKPLQNPWVDFGKQKGAVWLLVAVQNTSARPGKWMIDIQRPFVDELLVQKRTSGEPPETLLWADRNTPFEDRPVVSQYLVAPLWMEAGERAEILVGLRSSTGSWMPLTFATPERMRTAHMQEARFNWVINGAMVALVIIAIAMGRLVGWPLVTAFAAYVGLSALFVANNEGYLHRFIWPDAMGAYEPANLILLVGMMIAVLQFARLFAGLAKHYPRTNRAVQVLQALLIAVGVSSAFFWQSDTMRWAVFLHVPFVALAYFSTAILAWRSRVLGATPFLAGSAAILFTVATMAAVLLSPGRFPMTVALDYFHATLLFESFAFLVAILVRMLAIQRDLNRSLEAEVNATREKLQLAEALQESRNRYDLARTHAESLRARIAATSHDLQQPLLSLHRGLKDVAARDPEAAGNLEAALAYLQKVTESGLAGSMPKDDDDEERPDQGIETFPARLVLANCAAMFGNEARAAGIEVRTRGSDVNVTTEPVELMRAASNLVSNALKHARATRVLIAVQRREDHLLLKVIDNGIGLDQAQLDRLSAAYAKGEDSTGHGLGLHLVRQFAERPGHGFEMRSAPGRGTCMILRLPRGR